GRPPDREPYYSSRYADCPVRGCGASGNRGDKSENITDHWKTGDLSSSAFWFLERRDGRYFFHGSDPLEYRSLRFESPEPQRHRQPCATTCNERRDHPSARSLSCFC